MSTTAAARRMASRASHHTWLAALTRIGFIGYGLLHLAIAWLAVEVATSRAAGVNADQVGAFQFLSHQPAGHVLLFVMAVGLGAMALWQLLLAAVGHNNYQGKRRVAERISSLARTVVYGFLMWTDIKVLQGSAQPSSTTQERATAGVLAHPAGQWLVALAGIVVLAIGVGLAVYGYKRAFVSKLSLGSLSHAPRAAVIRLGRIGYVAKGVAFAIVGGLLFEAAISDSASRSRGLDGALRTLAGRSLGELLLFVIAAGFAAFGIYCFAQSKYRRI